MRSIRAPKLPGANGADAPHLSFETDGRQTELWFENARSLQSMMQLARTLGFHGISAWMPGQEDPAYRESLDEWQVQHPRSRLATG
jgi:hypothetical protein